MVLVERGRYLRLLHDLCSDADRGRGRVALVTGLIASGKTELLHVFAEQCRGRGAPVVAVPGLADRREAPLDWLRRLIAELRSPGREAGTAPRSGFDRDLADALSAALAGPADRPPALLVVDDVQHLDEFSMAYLVHLLGRIRSARVLAVLSESAGGRSPHRVQRTELLRQSHMRTVRLPYLSGSGVRAVIRDRTDADTANLLAPVCHAVTAGNPLLLRALLEDYADFVECTRPIDLATAPLIGDNFRDAVLTCLHGDGPGSVEIARAVAVLDGHSSADRVGRLTGRGRDDVCRTLHRLRMAGFLDGSGFRHPLPREAVLCCAEPAELSGLRAAARRILTVDGVHPVPAGEPSGRWAVGRLRSAAEQALADDRLDMSIGYLELALRGCSDDEQRAGLRDLLVRAEWRRDPAAAARHLSPLLEDGRAGRLDVDQVVATICGLVWRGRLQEAKELTGRLDRLARTVVGRIADPLGGGRDLRCPDPVDGPPATDPRAVAVGALRQVLRGGPGAESAAAAETVLSETLPADRTVEPMWLALYVLIYAGRAATAASWCDLVLADAGISAVPWWQALFSACRADIALRHGDLDAAAGYARQAIRSIGVDGWGVGAGVPLGVLVHVATELGDLNSAREYLRQPVPDTMFHVPYGLPYLRARGRYYLESGRPTAALADFRWCGDLMASWECDTPFLVPWRLDAAEVHLRLGHNDSARELAEEQLSLPGADDPWVRGASARVLGVATEDVRTRLRLLTDAVAALERTDDRLELVQAMFALGHALSANNQPAKAKMMLYRAGRLVEACGMGTTVSVPPYELGLTGTGSRPERPEPAAGAAVLTSAEYRVAVLASSGCPDEEIARRLRISVDAVERHVAMIFGKLMVARRTDPPVGLPRRDVFN